MKQVVLNNVTKRFTTKLLGTVTAVDNFNLEIEEGECFSFLGPSGCGKTTTLRMIAGFEDLSEGSIELCGRTVSDSKSHLYIPPEKRDLGMVFQAFAVWPHMNIFENVAFPLRVRKVAKPEIERRVKEALKHCSLDGMEKEYPGNLSGGQQQRIALARAIVTNPKVMLLDEPLSNLDPKLRESMRFEIKKLQREFGFTIVFVTHDQAEAMALSDRMLVMDMGHVVQIGAPKELYNQPKTRFVHEFLGESSFSKVILKEGKVYASGDLVNPLPVAFPDNSKGAETMILATRPNHVDMNHESGYPSRVLRKIVLTSSIEYFVKLGDEEIKIQTPHRNAFNVGDPCYLRFPNIMWYDDVVDEAEIERNRRQLI